MKHYILVALILFATTSSYAQDSSATINTTWIGIAADTGLTFQQITYLCDSQFTAAGYSLIPQKGDTADDQDGSPFVDYLRWKTFWATRLDFATGKPHSFAADPALALLSGSAGSADCGGTSALQSSFSVAPPSTLGWRFIGPQNITGSSSTLNQDLGRVNGIVVNTLTPSNIYVTDQFGGLWKTTNANLIPNNTWVSLSDNLPAIAGIGVTNLNVDFSTSSPTLYALMGVSGESCLPASTANTNPHTIGIFYSTNDGGTWGQISIPFAPLNDPIFTMQLWPGNTSTQKFLFVLTQFQIYRVDVTDPSSPIWNTIIDMTTIVPSDAQASRFWGFSYLTFLPANDSIMYVTTYSNYGTDFNAAAELFRIPAANTCGTLSSLPSVPIAQSDYLQGLGAFTTG